MDINLGRSKSIYEPITGLMKTEVTAMPFAGALFSPVEVLASEKTEEDAEVILTQLVDDIGAAERLEAADLLRTLTQ